MKIIHISTFDKGGAAKACIRLHQGLLEEGIDSKLLFLNQSNKLLKQGIQYIPVLPNKVEKLKNRIKRILRAFHLYPQGDKFEKWKYLKNQPKGFELFSFPDTSFDITKHPLYIEADIINLHWVAGFLDYNSFFKNCSKKIIWTLHDMNPFTGGCHYSGNCKKFENNCTNCPQLVNTIDPNYSNKILKTKIEAITSQCNLSIVSPSNWLLEQSKKSILFNHYPHSNIPYGLDASVFLPRDQQFSRELLGLPLDKKIILFVADSISNKRKGYEYLLSAIQQLENNENIVLCTVGSSNFDKTGSANVVELGSIGDERLMSAAYSAADVFVIPSIEDNLPNTVLEALMCGTPVVGFPIGGIIDMIEDGKNGYICEDISSDALAFNIKKLLNNRSNFNSEEIKNEAIKKYSLSVQAKSYINLYKKVLTNSL